MRMKEYSLLFCATQINDIKAMNHYVLYNMALKVKVMHVDD